MDEDNFVARCDFCGKEFDARKSYWLTLRPWLSNFMIVTPEKIEVEFPKTKFYKCICPWCSDKVSFDLEVLFNQPKEE